MPKFRKRPVVIEASRFLVEEEPWPRGVHCEPTGYFEPIGIGYFVYDNLQACEVRVNPGDWIITGVRGERYPCADDVFRETYEAVTP